MTGYRNGNNSSKNVLRAALIIPRTNSITFHRCPVYVVVMFASQILKTHPMPQGHCPQQSQSKFDIGARYRFSKFSDVHNGAPKLAATRGKLKTVLYTLYSQILLPFAGGIVQILVLPNNKQVLLQTTTRRIDDIELILGGLYDVCFWSGNVVHLRLCPFLLIRLKRTSVFGSNTGSERG